MTFTVYYPPAALAPGAPAPPALIFLSGLTCTDLNFVEKAGAARAAAAAGLALVAPDTSPRGDGVADDAAWDLGQGAGFYVDATQPPWAPHFSMASYIARDLLAALNALGNIDTSRLAITGHSMGGHGALTLGLRHPDLFASVSALAPISSAPHCPWGVKALTAYLGPADAAPDAWAAADGAACVASYRGPHRAILVDVGTADEFLGAGQLLPDTLIAAAAGNEHVSVDVRMQEGYGHDYFFIQTHIDDHIAHAAAALGL